MKVTTEQHSNLWYGTALVGVVAAVVSILVTFGTPAGMLSDNRLALWSAIQFGPIFVWWVGFFLYLATMPEDTPNERF